MNFTRKNIRQQVKKIGSLQFLFQQNEEMKELKAEINMLKNQLEELTNIKNRYKEAYHNTFVDKKILMVKYDLCEKNIDMNRLEFLDYLDDTIFEPINFEKGFDNLI